MAINNPTFSTRDILVAAIYAYEINDNSVVKFSETKPDSENKKIIADVLSQKIVLATEVSERLAQQAEALLQKIEQRRTLSLLTGSAMGDFFVAVANELQQEKATKRSFGIVAWAPKLLSDMEKQEAVKENLLSYGFGSQWVASPGRKITANFNLITKRYLRDKNIWLHQGVDTEGNIIKFWSGKEFTSGTITAKVKSHLTDERLARAKVTMLNYVKVV